MRNPQKPQPGDHLVGDVSMAAKWIRRCGYRAQTKIALNNESIFGHMPPAPVVMFWRDGSGPTKALARAGDVLRWDGNRITFRRTSKR